MMVMTVVFGFRVGGAARVRFGLVLFLFFGSDVFVYANGSSFFEIRQS